MDRGLGQEKSVQEKDRGEPAKEKELQTAAEVKHHCLKESFGINWANEKVTWRATENMGWIIYALGLNFLIFKKIRTWECC